MKAVLIKAHKIVTSILFVLTFVIYSSLVVAQSNAPRSARDAPRPIDAVEQDEGPLTTFEEEMRAKRAIKLAEKEHEENLNRAREIEQIGKELQQRLKNRSTIDRDSLKKIERLEKLTKKVRGEAGGEDEEVDIVNRPSDLPSAIDQIAEASASLSKNVQNTPRQVVSASVINNANVLLELIRLLRSFVRQP